MKKTNVVAIYLGEPHKPGACEIYRGNTPLHFLGQQKGWQAKIIFFADLWQQYYRQGANAWVDFVIQNDVFVLPRYFVPESEPQIKEALGVLYGFIKLFPNKRIVYETDDDYTNEYRVVIEGDAMDVASWADAITVTTPFLAERMRKKTKRPVYVLPNCIDPHVWHSGDAPERQPAMAEKIIVGLTGSTTHYGDWYVLKDVFPDFLERNPNVQLLLIGFHPDYLSGLPNTFYLDALPYLEYAQAIRGMDIVLAPVDPNDHFNLGKSPIKAVEGMGATRKLSDGHEGGAAVITTDNPVYRLAVKHEKTGLLTEHTAEGWNAALQRLVDDAELRKTLQAKGHTWAWKNHNIAVEWRQWAKAYQRILEAPPNPVSFPIAER